MRGVRLTNCGTTADAKLAEAAEGDGEGDDVGGEVADDHDILRIRGDELGRHAVAVAVLCWLGLFLIFLGVRCFRIFVFVVDDFRANGKSCYKYAGHGY